MATLYAFESFGGYALGNNGNAQAYARNVFAADRATSDSVVADPVFGKAFGFGGNVWAEAPHFLFVGGTLRPSFVFGCAFRKGVNRLPIIDFIDANNVVLGVTLGVQSSSEALSVSYNPAGTANDISWSLMEPMPDYSVVEVVISPTHFRLFLNNKEVFSKAWTGVAMRPQKLYRSYLAPPDFLIGYMYYADTRLGMAQVAAATPTTNANTGTVTGTLPAALTTFDGDTSYVTYTEGSAQSTVLNAAGLSAIPSDAVIHAVKLTASAAGAGGVAAGELTLETAAGASDVGEVNMALSYSTTAVVLNTDPATSSAFIASELAAGTVKFGVREG